MADNAQLIQLKKDIKAAKIYKIYLFYGEETYLKEKYLRDLEAQIPDGGYPEFNRTTFINRKFTYDEVGAAIEAFPFMAERKLITFNDSRLFVTKDSGDARKLTDNEKSFWKSALESLGDDTVVIFNETAVDKKSVLYKLAAKLGFVIEFSYMSERDLVEWTLKQCLDAKFKLKKDNAEYLVEMCDDGILNIKNELDKLFASCRGEITRNDIDRIVSKPMQYKIFDLTDGILNGDTAKIMSVMNELETQNEPVFGTLYLLFTTFFRILKARALIGAGVPRALLSQRLGCKRYAADKSADYAERIPENVLIELVTRVSDIDLDIKNGLVNERAALEKYVFDAAYMISRADKANKVRRK